jgi:hypothetical protein
MKRFLFSAALLAAGIAMMPEDASAQWRGGGGWRGGGFAHRSGGFAHRGGWRGGGFAYRGGWGGGWRGGYGYRRYGWGAGALAAGAVIGAAAASSYPSYGYGYGHDYYTSGYPTSHGSYGAYSAGCGCYPAYYVSSCSGW